MTARLITAQERLDASRNKDTVWLLGPYNVGKTSQLYTLPTADTLAIDWESGMKAVQTWAGDALLPESFDDMIDIATVIGGPRIDVRSKDFMSVDHHHALTTGNGPYAGLDLRKYRRIFVDSISRMMAAAYNWAQRQPGATAFRKDGTAVDDVRGTYGELGRMGVNVLQHLQRAPGKDVIFVGLLDKGEDALHRVIYSPQLMGQQTGNALPGIVDHIVCMVLMDYVAGHGWFLNWENGQHRAFVCRRINPWGLPAKTRCEEFIDVIEEPHLGKLLAKINQPAVAGLERLRFMLPDDVPSL